MVKEMQIEILNGGEIFVNYKFKIKQTSQFFQDKASLIEDGPAS